MTEKEYKDNMERLRAIEEEIKKPDFSLDRIETLLEESRKRINECRDYLRGIREELQN